MTFLIIWLRESFSEDFEKSQRRKLIKSLDKMPSHHNEIKLLFIQVHFHLLSLSKQDSLTVSIRIFVEFSSKKIEKILMKNLDNFLKIPWKHQAELGKTMKRKTSSRESSIVRRKTRLNNVPYNEVIFSQFLFKLPGISPIFIHSHIQNFDHISVVFNIFIFFVRSKSSAKIRGLFCRQNFLGIFNWRVVVGRSTHPRGLWSVQKSQSERISEQDEMGWNQRERTSRRTRSEI